MGHTAGPVALHKRFSPFTLPGIKTRFLGSPAPSLVTTLTQLSPIYSKRRLFQQW